MSWFSGSSQTGTRGAHCRVQAGCSDGGSSWGEAAVCPASYRHIGQSFSSAAADTAPMATSSVTAHVFDLAYGATTGIIVHVLRGQHVVVVT